MKQTFEIPNGCNRVTIEQQGNIIVTTFVPKFEDGDVIFTRWGDHNAICILKGTYNGDAAQLDFYASRSSQFGYREDCYVGTIFKRLDRHATELEKKQLFEEMAKKNKQWNAEKKRIENLKPKRWRAEEGCVYYYAMPYDGCLGHCCDSIDYRTSDDSRRYKAGNYFKTKAEANSAGLKMKELLKQINP